MDTTSIVFLTATAAVIVLIYILSKVNRQIKHKHVKEALTRYASRNGLKPGEIEIWNHNGIAFDDTGMHLLLLRNEGDSERFQSISLKGNRKCVARNTGRTVGYKGSNQNVIDRLELELLPMKNGESHTFLEIYDATEGITLTTELDLAERWASLINEKCKALSN